METAATNKVIRSKDSSICSKQGMTSVRSPLLIGRKRIRSRPIALLQVLLSATLKSK